MSRAPAITYAGSDIELRRRTARGAAVFVYLNRGGEPTHHFGIAWPWELRRLGWGLADIKAAIARLPGEAPAAGPQPQPQPQQEPDRKGGRLLHAHFALKEEDQ